MRALTTDGQKVFLDSAAADPRPAPGEALVRARWAVFSASAQRAATRGTFRGVLGSEIVGTVVEINLPKDAAPVLAARAKLKGRRVVVDPTVVCGACDRCRSGLKSHCRERVVMGVLGRSGCCAELVAVPLMNLLMVPDHVDDDHAVFAPALAAAAHSAQMFRVEGKPYITVLGDGPLGLLTAQVMARLNASVRLLGKHPEKFSLCERWSIKHRHVDDVGRRQDQDVVVDCTGSAAGLELALQLVRPRGKIILKSLPPATEVAPGDRLGSLVRNEVELVGSRDGSIEAALGMLDRHEVQVLPLISRRVKLGDAAGTFAQVGSDPARLTIVVET